MVRNDLRRRAREEEAAAMNELFSSEPNDSWEQIAPQLDIVLAELDEADRDAVLLRYFEGKSARQMAGILGTSDEAAQKRVSRVVHRLRELLSKRGVSVPASALAFALSTKAVEAAPDALAASILTSVPLAGAGVATTTTTTIAAAIAMTTMQKTLIAVSALLLCAGGVAIHARYHGAKKPEASAQTGASATIRLDDYVGHFEMPGHTIDLQKQGNGLAVKIDGKPGGLLALPQLQDEFVSYDHGSVTKLAFSRDQSRRVTHFTMIRDGQILGELKRTAGQ
jgi:hypothetical protein